MVGVLVLALLGMYMSYRGGTGDTPWLRILGIVLASLCTIALLIYGFYLSLLLAGGLR